MITDGTGARQDHPLYVALGDSISIDWYAGGPGRGGASLLARNRDDDFPEWRGRDLATVLPGLEFALLATDGGTTRGLLQAQLPRLRAMPTRPSIVTVTIGGNDVLQAYGRTRRALKIVRDVHRRTDEALGRVRELTASPDAPIVVGTVYDPSDGTADAGKVGLPRWRELVEVLATLNDALRAVAHDHGARVAPIAERFFGHGLAAGNPGSGEARPANRNLWYCNVIEPNAWGADGVRAAFWEALGGDALLDGSGRQADAGR